MGLVKMHLTSDWAWFTFDEFYEEEGVWISDEIEFDSPSSLLLLIESAEEVLPEELRHEMGRAVIKGAFGTWCPYWALIDILPPPIEAAGGCQWALSKEIEY